MRRAPLSLFSAVICTLLWANTAFGQKHSGNFLFEPASVFVNSFTGQCYYTDGSGYIYTPTFERGSNVSRKSSTEQIRTVTSSLFLDKFYGFVTGTGGIQTTTDGGTSWHVRTQPHPGPIDHIVYHPGTRRIFTASRESGLYVSTDRGLTWSEQYSGSFSGIAFNGVIGVVTGGRGGTSLRTTDGGMTWIEAEKSVNAVRPIYSLFDRAFVVASEGTPHIYHSTDEGRTWHVKVTLPLALLGDLAESCGKYYVPSDNGYYTNVDSVWDFVPVSYRKPTVYCVIPGRFYYVNGGFDKPRLNSIGTSDPMSSVKFRDVNILYYRCNTANTTESIQLSFSNYYGDLEVKTSLVSPQGNIQITTDLLDSAQSITLQILISGKDVGSGDSALIEVRSGRSCYQQLTYIWVKIAKEGERAMPTAGNLRFPLTSTCNKDQRYVYITNPDCEPITIDAAALRSTNGTFRLSANSFPRTLAGGARDSFLVEFSPSKIGAVADVLDISCIIDGKKSTLSPTINGSGAGSIALSVLHDTLDFGIVQCRPAFKSTSLLNQGCDSIKIDRVMIPAGSHFSIKGSPQGAWLQVDASDVLEIELDPRRTAPIRRPPTSSAATNRVLRSSSGSRCSLRLRLHSVDTPYGPLRRSREQRRALRSIRSSRSLTQAPAKRSMCRTRLSVVPALASYRAHCRSYCNLEIALLSAFVLRTPGNR
jgi:hypothetical protein